jgi:hypothetical protein
VNDDILALFKASQALVSYIDSEQVFDRSSDMGCGGTDNHQSETFYNLIAEARAALRTFESKMKP